MLSKNICKVNLSSITFMKKQFAKYIARVTTTVQGATAHLNSTKLLGSNVQREYTFYRLVYMAIDKFLQGNKSELFVQIPAFELYNPTQNIKSTDEYWYKLEAIVTMALQMSTIDEQVAVLSAPASPNDGDCFFYDFVTTTTGSSGPYIRKPFVTKTPKKLEEFLTVTKYKDKYKSSKCPHDMQEYEAHLNDIYRVSPDLLEVGSNRRNGIVNDLESDLDGIRRYKRIKNTLGNKTAQYKRALIVSLTQEADFIQYLDYCPWDSYIAASTVSYCGYRDFIKKYYTDLNYDVIVFVGDTDRGHSYISCCDYIRNKMQSTNDRLCKVVYMGTKEPQYVRTNYEKFTFTYREIYHYFRHAVFPSINIKWLKFDWLENTCKKIDYILQSDPYLAVDSTMRKSVFNRIIFPYLSWEFMGVSVPDERTRLKELFHEIELAEGYSISKPVLDEVCDYLTKNPTLSNPKKDWKDKQGFTSSNCFMVPRQKRAYKRDFDEDMKKSKGTGTILLDDLRENNRDVLKRMLQKCIKGEIHILTYTTDAQQWIDKKFGEEQECSFYNESYRKSVLGDGFPMMSSTTPTIKPGVLETMLDDTMLSALSTQQWTKSIQYEVEFDDKKKANIDGDIICDGKLCDIDDIYASCSNKKITYYYIKPKSKDFETWVNYYHNFEPGKDIKYYSTLWKDKFEDLYKREFHGDIKALSAQLSGIPETLIRRYIKHKDTSPHFLQNKAQLKKICKLLVDKNLLTKEQGEIILGAKEAIETNKHVGRELKKAMLKYALGQNGDIKILQTIIDNAAARGITIKIDEMRSKALHEGTISTMKVK